MIIININKESDKINFVILLESNIEIMGLLRPFKFKTLVPRTSEATQVEEEDAYITGTTNSKLYLIEQSFPLKKVETNTEITIRGSNLKGAVTGQTQDYTSYYLKVNDTIKIDYMDTGDLTTYKFKPSNTIEFDDTDVFYLEYFELIDEPKLESALFIDRGINNVFEAFKRLRTVDNIQELKQTGFGYFHLKNSSII